MESAGSLSTSAPRETRSIGRALGSRAGPGTLVALIGPLGAGKTELAKGVAEGLGVTSVVNSPTFVLMNEHVGRLRLFHIDAYRLDDPGKRSRRASSTSARRPAWRWWSGPIGSATACPLSASS